jgi:hypothetical protein
MGAKARAIEAGQFGVDEALLRRFVPMNGLAPAQVSQLLPFAGISELHPGDAIPTNFKTSDQAYYVVHGQLELYTGTTLAGSVHGGTEEARFPPDHRAPAEVADFLPHPAGQRATPAGARRACAGARRRRGDTPGRTG